MICSVVAFALALATPPWAQPRQAEEALTVGWAELDVSRLPPAYAHLSSLIPRLLMGATAFAAERGLGDGEQAYRRAGRAAAALEEARKAVAQAQLKADLLALTVEDPFRMAAESALAAAEAAKARAKLSSLLLDDRTDALPDGAVYGSLGLRPWQDHAKGLLLPPVTDPASVCADKKIDILIYGSAREVSGFIAVELSAYIRSSGQTAWRGVEYAPPDDLSQAVAAFTRPLATALLGRPYARLTFAVSPATADIRIDGRIAPATARLYMQETDVWIKASSAGFLPYSTLVHLKPGQDTEVNVALTEREAQPVLVRSEPSGATVHVDGVLAGTTPFELPGSSLLRVAGFSLDGREKTTVVISPYASEVPLVVLPLSDGLDFSARFGREKDRFYGALGWFVASLPVSVLSFGAFSDYRNILAELQASGGASADIVADLEPRYYTTQALFWVSAAASAGLAVNALVALVRYIQSTH